jgi:hypothetical protein
MRGRRSENVSRVCLSLNTQGMSWEEIIAFREFRGQLLTMWVLVNIELIHAQIKTGWILLQSALTHALELA